MMSQLNALFLILMMALPATIFARPAQALVWPSPSPLPGVSDEASPTPSGPTPVPGGCDEQCGVFKGVMNACQASPPSPEICANGTSASTNPSAGCCPAAFEAQWGQVPMHCAVMAGANTAKKSQMITASVYTAVAIGCLAACAFQWAGSGTACMIAGGAAAATDLVYSIMTARSIKSYDAMRSSINTSIGAGIGATAGAYGVGAISSNPLRGEACTAGAIAALMAGVKWYGMSRSSKVAKESCRVIEDFLSPAIAATTGGDTEPGVNSVTGGGGGSSSTTNIRNSGGGTSSYGTTAEEILKGNDPASSGAALAGPDSALLDKMPNRAQIPELLKGMGTNMGDIARRLGSESPANILGGMSGMPSAFGDAMKALDEDIKNGKIELLGVGPEAAGYVNAGSSAAMAGKGSGGESPFASLGSMFNKELPKLTGGTELNFNGKSGLEVLDSDIWHTGAKKTIFEIVSTRYDRSRSKLSTLDWASPLNRALLGLPALKEPDPKPTVKNKAK
ncbi:MAG TPA: hypothetical protein VJB59_15460 [Bdellovibrionota bacterium]|nr:hypothetical protein [Bdellovibrionota bacterium]